MDAERRKHKRLPLRFSVLCQKVGLSDGRLYCGSTVNICPGGMLVEVNNAQLNDGELVSVEMSVPPTEGLLEFGGSFSSYARVIRSGGEQEAEMVGSSMANAVAMEFCEPPRLRI
jgi:hypothetical protein